MVWLKSDRLSLIDFLSRLLYPIFLTKCTATEHFPQGAILSQNHSSAKHERLGIVIRRDLPGMPVPGHGVGLVWKMLFDEDSDTLSHRYREKFSYPFRPSASCLFTVKYCEKSERAVAHPCITVMIAALTRYNGPRYDQDVNSVEVVRFVLRVFPYVKVEFNVLGSVDFQTNRVCLPFCSIRSLPNNKIRPWTGSTIASRASWGFGIRNYVRYYDDVIFVTGTGINIWLLVNCCFDTAVVAFLAATTIFEAGKECSNPTEFNEKLLTQLGDFGFPEVFVFDVWGVISDAKKERIQWVATLADA